MPPLPLGWRRSWRSLHRVLRRAGAAALEGLPGVLLGGLVGGLPPRWLAPLAQGVASFELWLRPRRAGRTARELALLWGEDLAPGLARRWTREGRALAWLGWLHALHPRSAARAACRDVLTEGAPSQAARELLLLARLGAWPLARAAARLAARRTLDVDVAPDPGTADVLWLPWLGRLRALNAEPLARALATGSPVRLLLVLPSPEGGLAPWLSPSLTAGRDARHVARSAQRVLDATELLARADPGVVDWTAPRLSLRPEPARRDQARDSRWHPPATRRRRPPAARRAR